MSTNPYQVPGTGYAYSSDANNNLNTQRASGMPLVNSDGSNLAVVSTNISVFSNNMKVGFIQSFNPSETRTITPLHELGTEGVIQNVAGNTTGGTIAITRFAVYNASLWNALGLTRTGQYVEPTDPDYIAGANGTQDTTYVTYGNPFKTLKDQRVPLEIKVETSQPAQSDAVVTETYIDCWLQAYSKTISSQTITVTETCTASYSDIV